MCFLPDFLQSTLRYIIIAKNPIKVDGHNNHMKDKRESQKKIKGHANLQRTKERRRASPSRGRKLIHPQPL